MIIGDPDIAAIVFELDEPRDTQWLFGQFQLRVRGEAIGDWDDGVTLSALARAWQTFAAGDDVVRWDPELAGLSALEVFTTLYDAAYVEEHDENLVGAYPRYHVNGLGMSSFDPFVVVLVEPPDDEQWLLWRREDGVDGVHGARLPPGTLQALGREFAAQFDLA